MSWNWEAISAVATAAAAIVALFFGVYNIIQANRSAKHERAERELDLAVRLHAACGHYVLSATFPAEQSQWMGEVNALACALEAYGWQRPDGGSLDYRENLRAFMKEQAEVKP
ncbi:hypothetical protein [Bifidobacterium apicola]|uniref:hypothetical protein n=1 Tax=Bifidobacterium apicola TaxID=3230739 RepID=UPI0036F20D39